MSGPRTTSARRSVYARRTAVAGGLTALLGAIVLGAPAARRTRRPRRTPPPPVRTWAS